MNKPKLLSETILEMGDDFALDAMEDYEERLASGEFEGKSDAEIRDIYYEEALADEENEELERVNEQIRRMEEDQD